MRARFRSKGCPYRPDARSLRMGSRRDTLIPILHSFLWYHATYKLCDQRVNCRSRLALFLFGNRLHLRLECLCPCHAI